MSLPKLLTRKFFFQINIFFKARDILDVLGKHMELIISQSKNHAVAHESPSMKARNSQTRKGGGLRVGGSPPGLISKFQPCVGDLGLAYPLTFMLHQITFWFLGHRKQKDVNLMTFRFKKY